MSEDEGNPVQLVHLALGGGRMGKEGGSMG